MLGFRFYSPDYFFVFFYFLIIAIDSIYISLNIIYSKCVGVVSMALVSVLKFLIKHNTDYI